jgi:hypothetical protein
VSVLELAEVLPAAAVALEPTTDAEPPVHIDYPDAVQPPALIVIWSDPMLEAPGTMVPGALFGHVGVLAVAGRLEAGPGVETLQELVRYVVGRMRLADDVWPLELVTAPKEFVIANISYLGARVDYRVPVAI